MGTSTLVSQVVPPGPESWLESLAAASRGPLSVVPCVSQNSTLISSEADRPRSASRTPSSLKVLPMTQPRALVPATAESQVLVPSFQTRRSCQLLSTFTYMM